MKVMVTGANGFVGRNVCPYLSTKYDLFKCYSKKHNLLYKNDSDELLEYYRPDVVVHLAGVVGGIGANRDNPGRFIYENLKIGMNIIQSSLEKGVKKFIMLSTVCAYPKFTPTPFKEEYLWNGYPEETNAPYGVAKRTLMCMLEAYYKQYGFKYLTLIPTNMYGPHDHFNTTTSHVIPSLIEKVTIAKRYNTDLEIWGSGNVSREFLYAEDLAVAIEKAIHSNFVGYLNIGTGIETKIKDLVEIICNKMNYSGAVRYNQNYPDGQPKRCLNVSLAKNILDFSAKTNLSTGLERTIEWYHDNIRYMHELC